MKIGVFMSSISSRISEVFDILSKGNFICSNAIDKQRRHLYRYVEENFQDLETKFREIGYQLEAGNNYYYFSRPDESNQNVDNKIEKAFAGWIFWLFLPAIERIFAEEHVFGSMIY